ncbi:MAG: hypothetical protein ACFFG0_07950 [Candidatus Thorarchaeota archaeon]
MKDEYTNDELRELEIISDDLILILFETREKRYAIRQALKKAFQLGRTKK